MNRIILGMATTNYVMVAITMYLGRMSHPTTDPSTLEYYGFHYHIPFGIFTAIFTLLVHSLVFTYFLGTNRWVRETAAAYALDEEIVRRSRRCRTRAFMMAVISMLLVVATVATGAGTHTHVWPHIVHQLVPATTYLFMLPAYYVEYQAVTEHMALTDEVMEQVNSRRRARGQSVA